MDFIAASVLTIFAASFVFITPIESVVDGITLLLLFSLLNVFLYALVLRTKQLLKTTRSDGILLILLWISLAAFGARIFYIAAQFPSRFPVSSMSVEQGLHLAFVPIIAYAVIYTYKSKCASSDLKRCWIRDTIAQHIDGLALCIIFFTIYVMLGSVFNQPVFNTDDIFFDADAYLWRSRFATTQIEDIYWRPVHPFILIIVRPLVWIVSIALKGNTLAGAVALNAMMGSLCLYAVWYITARRLGNAVYASLVAALYGASAAELSFSSLIETYIYLEATALLFIVLIFKDSRWPALIATGLISFGLTISSFAQTVIVHLLVKRDLWGLFRYGLGVAILVVPFALLNEWVYPNSQPPFWDLSAYKGEKYNSFPATLQRADYLGRVMMLYSIVAPKPLILDEEIPFLKIWMSRAPLPYVASATNESMQVAHYDQIFGVVVAFVWFGALLLGAFLFITDSEKREDRFCLAFLAIMLFNFALHMNYGKDVFLYSANWTYALVLFLSFSLSDLSATRWFHVAFLIFIVCVTINNSDLIFVMLDTTSRPSH